MRLDEADAEFLSTPSARRATWRSPSGCGSSCNFYPRPPRGGRPNGLVAFANGYIFLSTPSARRATTETVKGTEDMVDFYPRPPRGGRRYSSTVHLRVCTISIHALREEGDTETSHRCPAAWHFYPRPPRGGRQISSVKIFHGSEDFYPRPPRGGRLGRMAQNLQQVKFLSTPSARRATPNALIARSVESDFYPRPPRGGRRFVGMMNAASETISIHALREEGDCRR